MNIQSYKFAFMHYFKLHPTNLTRYVIFMSKYFLISLMICSLTCGLFRSMLFSFQIFGGFLDSFYYWFYFNSLMVREQPLYGSSFFNYRDVFYSLTQVNLRRMYIELGFFCQFWLVNCKWY